MLKTWKKNVESFLLIGFANTDCKHQNQTIQNEGIITQLDLTIKKKYSKSLKIIRWSQEKHFMISFFHQHNLEINSSITKQLVKQLDRSIQNKINQLSFLNIVFIIQKEIFKFIILQSHPGDYQTYRMIIDQWTFENQRLDLGVKCLGCGETDHDIDQCHRLHLILKKQILLAKHLYSVPHKRALFQRNCRRTTNAKFGQKLFEDAVSLFQENNFSFSSEEEEPNPSQLERTHQTKMTQEIRYQEPTHNTHRSQQQQQHQQSKNVRFRKRSRSLNSISVHSDEESKFQKSMSGYKSNDSQIDKISGIPVKVQQLPSSQLSQSSFNVFLKEYPKRKISKQQDSDKYSNHSIGQRQYSAEMIDFYIFFGLIFQQQHIIKYIKYLNRFFNLVQQQQQHYQQQYS